jgi:hypothetical protein
VASRLNSASVASESPGEVSINGEYIILNASADATKSRKDKDRDLRRFGPGNDRVGSTSEDPLLEPPVPGGTNHEQAVFLLRSGNESLSDRLSLDLSDVDIQTTERPDSFGGILGGSTVRGVN